MQWCEFAEAIVEDFKLQYLPVISANRDIPAVIHVMTKYMWDYEIISDCLTLLVEWTRPVEGEIDMNTLIDSDEEVMEEDGEEVMEAGSEEVMEAGGEEVMEAGGKEVVEADGEEVVEADGEEVMEAGGEEVMEVGGEEVMEAGGEEVMEAGGEEVMEAGGEGVMDDSDTDDSDMETDTQKLQEECENLQLSNDQMKDDLYEVAHIDNKVDVFESLVDVDREVKMVAVGHVVDAGTLVEYNNIMVMIVKVMEEFKIVYRSLVDVKSQCLQCLANLAAFHEVRVQMGTREFFQKIMSTIDSININSDIGRAVNVLMAACEGNDSAKQAFIDETGFLFLAKLCRRSNESKYIDFEVCLFVLDLCKREGAVVCMQEVDSIVIGFLRNCAAKYVDIGRFMHNVSRTIQFVVTNTSNKKEFMKDGGMQVMETILAKYSDNPVVREFTSAALDNMRT